MRLYRVLFSRGLPLSVAGPADQSPSLRSVFAGLFLWIIALLSLLATPAFADDFTVITVPSISSSNSLYTATMTIESGNDLSSPCSPFLAVCSLLSINGPDGITEYAWPNGPLLSSIPFGRGFVINDYGQVVGYTDGGTSDPTIWYAEYYADSFGTFVGTGPFIGIGSGPIAACRYNGVLGGEVCVTDVLSLDDAGLVTDSLTGVRPGFVDEFQLPNSVPEPTAIIFLATVVIGVGFGMKRRFS